MDSLFDDEPSLETAIAIHTEASKILHAALDREYRRRRANLVNAGMSRATSSILPNLQNDVRDMAVLINCAGEHKKTIHACFANWNPSRVIPEVRLFPVTK